MHAISFPVIFALKPKGWKRFYWRLGLKFFKWNYQTLTFWLRKNNRFFQFWMSWIQAAVMQVGFWVRSGQTSFCCRANQCSAVNSALIDCTNQCAFCRYLHVSRLCRVHFVITARAPSESKHLFIRLNWTLYWFLEECSKLLNGRKYYNHIWKYIILRQVNFTLWMMKLIILHKFQEPFQVRNNMQWMKQQIFFPAAASKQL